MYANHCTTDKDTPTVRTCTCLLVVAQQVVAGSFIAAGDPQLRVSSGINQSYHT